MSEFLNFEQVEPRASDSLLLVRDRVGKRATIGSLQAATGSTTGSNGVDITLTPQLTGQRIELSPGVFKPLKIVKVDWTAPWTGANILSQPHNIPNVDRFVNLRFICFDPSILETLVVTTTYSSAEPLRFFATRTNMNVGGANKIGSAYFQNAFAVLEYWEV